MKNKPIVGANRDDITIDITLPVDADGEYAFDAKGKVIKGKEAVEFSIPRFDFLPRDQFKALNKRLEELSTDLPLDEYVLGQVMAMIQDFVTPEQLALVENLRLFELKQVAKMLKDGNDMTVGELLASTRS